MQKFIPYEKLSKKKKRELDAGRRTVWAISPVTRKSENPKAYNRRKAQKWKNDSGSVLSVFTGSDFRKIGECGIILKNGEEKASWNSIILTTNV